MTPTGPNSDHRAKRSGRNARATHRSPRTSRHRGQRRGHANAGKTVEQVREQAAHKIGTFADAIRRSARGFSSDEHLAPVAPYLEQVADRIEPLSGYLRDHD